MIDCPVCGRAAAVPFLARDAVPVHQNLVYATEAAAIAAPRGDLHLACCHDCGFVFNAAFDFGKLSYGDDYANDQTCSPAFSAYVDGLVRHLVEERGVRDCTIVEVGCGRGYFLRRLVEYPGANNRGIGFDPAHQGAEVELDGRLRFERRYYGPDCTSVAADVVVCRHVIEHLPRPAELVAQVHGALAASPSARLFFETPDVEWILRNHVIRDLFYEHCSLFSGASLTTLFEVGGVRVDAMERVFGGQYLWLEGRRGDGAADVRAPGETPQLATRFAAHERDELAQWQARTRELRNRGKVAIWGAGAKGVTFANLVDPARDLVDCVVDLNPEKQGAFIAGTGHPIVAPGALGNRGVATAIVMNPNYLDENRRLVAEEGLAVELVV